MASIEGFNRSKLKEVNKNIRGEVIKVSKYRAGSAIEDDEDRTEYRDSMEEIDRKVEIVADLVKSSKYFVAYTGAGISTSCFFFLNSFLSLIIYLYYFCLLFI